MIFDRVLAAALVVGLAVPIWRFLSRLPPRLSYPWELEWMEGGVVSHIHRVLAGEQLYVAPSLRFTPFIYTPFYYYICAAVAKLVGEGYLAPRLVSSAAILGCFVLLFWWVWKETQSSLAGLVASSLFAATFDVSARWFDVARGDSLLLLLLLGACVCARLGQGIGSYIVTGIALALAFFTKQSALSVAAPVLIALAVRVPRRGWIATACFAGLVALGVGLLQLRSGGWFSFYAFELPAHHGVAYWLWREALLPIWSSVAPMTLCSMAVVCGVPLLREDPRTWFATGLLVVCSVAGSIAGLLHTGGYPNVLMPALACMSVATGLVVARLRAPRTPSCLRLRVLAAGGILLQLSLLNFGACPAVPSAHDAAVGARIIERMSKLTGPVWCTSSNYYPVLAGHPEQFTHAVALVDVFKGTDSAFHKQLLGELERDLKSGTIRTIVTDRTVGFLPPSLVSLIHANYRLRGHLAPEPDAANVWPNTGAGVRPDEIWTFAGSLRKAR